jgi:hypothetical protein
MEVGDIQLTPRSVGGSPPAELGPYRRVVELLGLDEIRDLLGGISKQRAMIIVGRKGFPDPVVTLKMGRVWDGGAVRAWIAENRPGSIDEE